MRPDPYDGPWHDRWIGMDDGVPHVRGTVHTVAEIQQFWRRPGVYAAELRAQFPDLSEAQLGAAVTWAPSPTIGRFYVAESEGPPRRKLYLWQEQNAPNAERKFSGWLLAVLEFDDAGQEMPVRDEWEETLEAILRYPEMHAPRDVAWRDANSGDLVDIYALKD